MSDRILQAAIEAAKLAGDVLMRYREQGVTMRDKSALGGKTYDLVSDADLESEQVIAALIESRFADHAILGEEAFQETDIQAEHLWIVDPLDGTNNYAHGLDHFAVSIGYYESGRAKAGVIWNPSRGDLYTAIDGGGAFHNSRPVKVSDHDQLNQSMIGCGFYYDRGEMMRCTLSAIEDCFEADIHGIRRFGTASLDLCLVGCGQLDAFFEYNLSPWDFAAGALFVREAGGRITTGRGDPLQLTPTSVLVSNDRLHPKMLSITKRHHPKPPATNQSS
ncbi:MAG: inositol monophosphatase family protein [Planctomycetota bacterium]